MGVMFDSSVLIEAERKRIDLDARLAALGQQPVAISAVTVSELLHGVHRARGVTRKSKRERFVEWAIREIPVAAFGLLEARVHARLWANLLSRGQNIGAHDLMIAATAIALDYDLVTANLRDFDRVPDLRVSNWDESGPGSAPD